MTTVTDIKEKEEGFGLNKSGGGNSAYFQEETDLHHKADNLSS